MRNFEVGAVSTTAPNFRQWRCAQIRQRKRDLPKVHASTNVILEAEEFTKDLYKRVETLRNNPNAKITDVQNAKEDYFRGRSITLGLHDLTYDGNEDFSHYKFIANAVKHCEKHSPEVGMLWLGVPIVGGMEKWVIRQMSNQLLTKIKNENHGK